MPQTNGERILGGFQDLLFKMRTGKSIPVTELSKVALPCGRTMIVHNETFITFGDTKDGEGQE